MGERQCWKTNQLSNYTGLLRFTNSGQEPPGDQRRIVYLEGKPGFHHRFVVALAAVGQRIEIRLFRLVILVPEEVGYPPGAEHGKETIVHACTSGRDARLHDRDFVL